MAALTRAAQELRVGSEALAGDAARQLDRVLARFSTADAARDALERILPELVRLYGAAAATWAADWYDTQRYEINARGTYQAKAADLDDAGADVLARWGVDPLYQREADWAAARVLITGGLQRRIVNYSRDTITASSVADPAANGWQRVGTGACGFCRMLIDRGAVYSEATVGFPAHDHCRCAAVPAWGGQPQPVTQRRTPKPTDERSRADYERARRWMKEHGY